MLFRSGFTQRQFHVCYYVDNQSLHQNYQMVEIDQFISILHPDDQVAVKVTENTRYFVKSIEAFVAKL